MSAALAHVFDGTEVRSVVVDDDPWFILSDVCKVLGIANVGNVLARLDDDEKGSIRLADGTSGNPNKAIVNEPGLYTVVIRSDAPAARRFRRWIAHEVLPAIRRTGAYSTPVAAPALPTTRELAEMVIAEADRADAAEAQVRELAPKAEAHDAFLTATDSLAFAEVARAVGFGRTTLFRRLRELDILQANNLPYRRYDHHFEVVLGVHTDRHGVTHPHHTTRVRPSGVDFIRRRLTATDMELTR